MSQFVYLFSRNYAQILICDPSLSRFVFKCGASFAALTVGSVQRTKIVLSSFTPNDQSHQHSNKENMSFYKTETEKCYIQQEDALFMDE